MGSIGNRTVAAGLLALAASCGPASGRIQMTLTDAPLDDAATMTVTIDEVQVHVAVNGDGSDETADAGDDATPTDADAGEGAVAVTGHSGWKTVCATPAEFDLLTLQNGATAPMCPEATIDAGKVTQIRLVVSKAEVTWKNGDPATALEIPSGEVKIVGVSKTLPAGGALNVTLDFDAGKSVVDAAGKLQLKPTIKVVE